MIDNDIQQLLKRFMAGETSPEEERQIGRYLSTHEPETDDEKAYKAMFAWFDDGMKTELPAPEKPVRKNRKTAMRIVSGIAATAAAILLLLILTPKNEPETAGKITAKAVIEPEKAEVRVDTIPNDTTARPSQNIRKIKSRHRVRRYEVAPPQVMVAQAEPDSLHETAITIAEAKIEEIERQQTQLEEELDMITNVYEWTINLYTAALEGDDIYYIEEGDNF